MRKKHALEGQLFAKEKEINAVKGKLRKLDALHCL